jgi:hypothetical protein
MSCAGSLIDVTSSVCSSPLRFCRGGASSHDPPVVLPPRKPGRGGQVPPLNFAGIRVIPTEGMNLLSPVVPQNFARSTTLSTPRYEEPRSGERMQPTAQAVGQSAKKGISPEEAKEKSSCLPGVIQRRDTNAPTNHREQRERPK